MVPAEHPLRQLFQELVTNTYEQIGIFDRELESYVSGLLVDFSNSERLYPVLDAKAARSERSEKC